MTNVWPRQLHQNKSLTQYLILNVLSTVFNSLFWSCLVLLWSHWQLYLDLLPVWPWLCKFGCACTLRTAVSTVMNFALLPAGYNSDSTIGGFTFMKIALSSYHDLPDLLSADTLIDLHTQMRDYVSNYTSRTYWFVLAGTHCSLAEPAPLNLFKSIKGLSNTEVDDSTLPAYFREQSDVPSPWNTYWTEAAAYRGGLELDDHIFGNSWTMYWGPHAWFDCDPELACECEGYNCLGTHSMEGHAPAAQATAKSELVPLIVIEPLSPTSSEIDAYNWHW